MKKSTLINRRLESGLSVITIEPNCRENEQKIRRIMPLIKHAGFNALELMLVLAVIAVGIGVAIHTMTGNSNSQNTNQMVSDVTALVSNVKANYTSSTDGYTSVSTDTAVSAGLIPTDLKLNGTTVQSQFQGGTIEITPANSGEAFSITYTSVPSAICNKVVATLAGSAFLTIDVGGTAVYDSVNNIPIVPATISTQCGGSGNTATIIFTAS